MSPSPHVTGMKRVGISRNSDTRTFRVSREYQRSLGKHTLYPRIAPSELRPASIVVCADPVPSPRQPPIYGILRSKMGQGRLCLRERLGFYVPGWPRYRNTLPALPTE